LNYWTIKKAASLETLLEFVDYTEKLFFASDFIPGNACQAKTKEEHGGWLGDWCHSRVISENRETYQVKVD
jgi:hypothetical protein